MVAPEGSSTSEELQTMESLSRSLASGRYRIMRILGAGAMGSVRLAEDTALHRRVAIKTVKEEVARNPEIRRRIERECLLHAKVGPHPNIVTLFDKLEADDEMHLVMEYIDGETLQARLERNSEMGIVMPPSESIHIASQVLDALSRIHAQQIVHRDIKPANIMLTYNESGTVCAKLMDFGISRFAEDNEQLSRLTTTNNGGPGTPLYMAPEQIDSKTFGEVSYATDVYAMGVMLYQLLSGKPPFRGTLTEVLNGHLNMPVPHIAVKMDGVLPETIEGLLKRALAKKTVDRIQSAKAFREELIALTGVGDTMSRLNATVQLGGSASNVNAQTIQSGLRPTTTQTFFGGNTMMRLARYRRSKVVLGLGGAFALTAIVLSAWLLIGRGDGAQAKVASDDQPVGEVVSGALTPQAPAAPQAAAPGATTMPNTVPPQTQAPLETQTVTAPVTQGVAVDPNAPVALQGQVPVTGQTPMGVVPVPVAPPAGDASQLNASVVPGVAPVPGTTPLTAEANQQGVTGTTAPGTDPGAAPATTAEQVPPTMIATAQPNALSPTGTPVVVEGATVQSPEELKTYTVKSGDTLSKIAKANNITVEDLRWWNDILNPYSLKVGQDLKLYAAADIKPKDQFLSEASAAEKARKEAAAAKAAESGASAPQESAPAPSSGETLEGQFKGTPVAPATPPAKQEEKKPKRGLFRGMFNR